MMKISIGVSNRHVHLTREHLNVLFGEGYELEKKNDLTQPGQYASTALVTIKTEKSQISNVRVLGPIRDYTQVEVSKDDALLLGINPPVRDSGDLENSESVYLEGPCGKIFKKNCCIRANRHIHCNKLENIGHNNNDIVSVSFNNKTIDDVDNVRYCEKHIGETFKGRIVSFRSCGLWEENEGPASNRTRDI